MWLCQPTFHWLSKVWRTIIFTLCGKKCLKVQESSWVAMVKNGLPLLNLAYAIFIIKILKVTQDPTIKYCHNILRDQAELLIILHPSGGF